MYCSVEEVKRMIKDDAFNAIIGNTYIESADERSEKIQRIVEDAIQDAQNEIDGYLTRYPLPLTSVPQVIQKYAKDIAVYNLYSRIGINESDREKNYLNRYNAAIKYLTLVAEGKIELFSSSSSSASSSNSGRIQIQNSTRLFNRNSLKGM